MLNINFVIPTLFYWNQPFKQQPLTPLYLATLVDENFQGSVNVEITDLRGKSRNEIYSIVPERDVYLYSIASPDFSEIASLVSVLRKKYPKSKHIAGGPHVNIFPKETQEFFDSISLGNGEESLIQIINNIKNGQLKKSYQIKPDYGSKKYPFPRRHYLPREKIVRDNLIKCFPGVNSTSTLFSHGCPFECVFCANYNRGKEIRRTNTEIAEEIEYLQKEYGINGLAMLDEVCMPLNEKEAIPYLETIGKFNLIWRGQLRIGLPKHVMKLAREVGCLEINLGVESVSQQVLDITNKRIKIDDAKQAIKTYKEAGIKTYINLVNGLPGEPENIVELTKDFINETKPDLVNLFSLCLYPGSPLAKDPAKFGIDSSTIIKEYDRYNHCVRRFEKTEDNLDNLVLFEYFPKTKWGKSFSRKQIIQNYLDLQEFVISHNLNK